MTLPRLLQVTHGHTRFHPGGTEMVALALHRHWRSHGEDCWYLGAAEPEHKAGHPGTNMVAMTADQREAVIHTDGFSRLRLEQPDYFGALREFENYLALLKPDIVHFHHVLNLGLESIHIARRVLPAARIVLTLHDYYLICANNGQLFRHHVNKRCMGPNLRDCTACMAIVAPEDLRMRALDVRQTLKLVDQIISPSEFLAGRMRDGLEECPPIAIVHNTYVGPDVAPAAQREPGGDFVFSYFGNLSRIKGAGDLVAAAGLLVERGVKNLTIRVHGAQLFADSAFDEQLAAGKAALGSRLQFMGRYDQSEIAERMSATDCVVSPSLWWENAPLVIYEALHHGRKVVAYPHGGAAEILKRHGGGLLAGGSHPADLADAMHKVLREPGQAAGIRSKLQSIGELADVYAGHYQARPA